MRQPLSRPTLLAFAAILLLAAALRLYHFDLIDVRYDESLPANQALQITQGMWLGLAPFSGSVINHPPVYLYLLALPYLVTHSFVAILLYRIGLDLIALALCAWMCRRYFGPRVARVACGLYAVAPWAVQSARKLSIEALPLFSLILIIGLLEVLNRRNPRGWVVAGVGLSLAIGTHLSAAVLLPVYGLGLILSIRARTFKPGPVLLGLVPLALIFAAYLAHDLSHGAENLLHLFSPGTQTPGAGGFSWNAVLFPLWFSGGTGLHSLTGGAYAQWAAQPAQQLEWLNDVQMGLQVLAVLMLIVRLKHTRTPAATALVLGWWLLPMLLQLITQQSVQLHYFTSLYPAPFVLMGLAVDLVGRETTRLRPTLLRPITSIMATVLGILLVWQIYTTARFNNFIATHDTPNGYGLPIGGALTARASVIKQLPAGDEVIVVINGFPTPWNEQATLLRAVMADVPYRFLNSESDGFVMRPNVTHYLFAPGTESLLQHLLEVAAPNTVTQQSFLSKVDGTHYTTVVLGQPIAVPDFQSEPNAVWANRLELVKHHTAISTTALSIETVLRVLDPPSQGADFHWFNRVFTNGQQIGQLDGAGVHPSSWRVGDLIYLHFTVPLANPSQATQIRIGTYTYPDLKPVRVSIPGQPAEESVLLNIES